MAWYTGNRIQQNGGYSPHLKGIIRLAIMGRIGICILLLGMMSLVDQAQAQNVLLVHDAGAAPMSSEQRLISTAVSILSHFEGAITVVAAEEYRSHLIDAYDAAIYLGIREGTELPEVFLTDCYDADRPLCWLGANLNQLSRRFSLGRYGFAVQDAPAEAVPGRVVYRGMAYWREEAPLRRIMVTQPQVCEVISAIESDGEALPYAVRSRNLWYFAEMPLDRARRGGTHLILCDQLHEFLNQTHPDARTAILYVAGVTPDTDAGRLTALLRQLRAEGVAFGVEVAPVLTGAEPGQLLLLTRKRGLVGVLRGAQGAGASIVAAIRDPAVDSEADGRLEGDPQPDAASKHLSLPERMERAFQELSHCDLYPVAWAMRRELCQDESASDISDMCSTILERRPDEGSGRDGPVLPFLTQTDQYAPRVMPDNVPTLRTGQGEVEAILEAARRQATVSDPFITVAIVPEAPQKAVSLLVEGLRNMDYEFADLRHARNRTRGESLDVQTVDSQHFLTDLVPKGWDVTLIGAGAETQTDFDQSDSDQKEETVVHPGTLVVSYPPGQRPDVILSFEGDMQQVAQRLVQRIAHIVLVFALAVTAVLLLVYVFQAAQRRGA